MRDYADDRLTIVRIPFNRRTLLSKSFEPWKRLCAIIISVIAAADDGVPATA
jgi:hypothetical protein